MSKIQKIVGMKVDIFQQLLSTNEIKVRPARLIPSPDRKSSFETTLASIFLSSVKLIKEFRDDIFSDLKVKRNGTFYFFTEPTFFDCKDRPDGLILQVVAGEIRDAVILEIKHKNAEIDDSQIIRYMDLAKTLGISKILTISNQFVPDPSISPVKVKPHKGIVLYHFSWQYLLTIAHVLLYKNDHNISDEDQVSIMREVVAFWESSDSGVYGFTQMRNGWKEIVKTFTTGSIPKKDDKQVQDAILSWQQEERDLSLILSRKLGLLVKIASAQEIHKRIESDYKTLISKKYLSSRFKVENIVSPIDVIAHFDLRTIEMSVLVEAPEKGIKGQIGWMRRQIEDCEKKANDIYGNIVDDLRITPNLKYRNEYQPTKICDLENAIDDLKEKEITSFTVSYIVHLGAKFESSKNFVVMLEKMLIDYYSGIIQYLSNPPKSTPKIVPQKSNEEDEIIATSET